MKGGELGTIPGGTTCIGLLSSSTSVISVRARYICRVVGTALSIRSKDSSLEDVRPRINPNAWHYLQGVCGPLLRVAGDSTVHLVHQTTKEFLARFWDCSIDLPESNIQLASICLRYLLFSGFKNHPSEFEDRHISLLNSHDPLAHQKNNPTLDQECQKCLGGCDFLDYAITHWLAHFEAPVTMR